MFLIALLVGLAAAGAATAQAPDASAEGPAAAESSIAVEVQRGEPRELLDGIGWVVGVPNKLLLLDRRADNHDVSPETVAETTELLAARDVDGVMVRVNQYDPIGEWRRLAKNDRVGLPWRATVGVVYTLGYSVLPGRVFGGDWYNPFTDTVHVYSDVPALAMEQAAQAYDTHRRSHPGLYSATKLLPLVGLVHEARAKEVVFEHVDEHGTLEERAEARRVLTPQLGREVGGQAALFLPQGDALFSLTGAAIGHVVGRIQADRIDPDGPPGDIEFWLPSLEEMKPIDAAAGAPLGESPLGDPPLGGAPLGEPPFGDQPSGLTHSW
ncbi:hypothetical protein [Botrimarina sp.]|uniref:hypothetical protein n=1 Tax=Botrimarina sp. TaxID=2795802 RepID=UPI0032ECAD3C